MRFHRARGRGAALLAALSVLSACTAEDAAAPSVADVLAEVARLDLPYDELLDHLYARALENGEEGLAHYGQTSSPTPEAWTAAFEARFPGLAHRHARLRSTEIVERVLAETDAGRVEVDVIDATAPGLARLVEADVLTTGVGVLAHGSVPAANVLDHGIDLWTYPYVLGWNTELTSGPTGPLTWDGVLGPDVSGCIITDGMTSWYAALIGMMGYDGARDWVDRFVAVGGRYLVGVSGSARTAGVASGEYPCTLGGSPHELERLRVEDGAPVDWAPIVPAPVVSFTAAVHAAAPNPYSAALFVAWASGPEGSLALSQTGRPATSTAVTPAFPRVAAWASDAAADPDAALLIDLAEVLRLEVEAADLVAELSDAYPAG